jgi:hypothetical protein
MTPKEIAKLKQRIVVLNRLIIRFSYSRKLVRRCCGELLDKEAKLRQNIVQYKVTSNGQLCLF